MSRPPAGRMWLGARPAPATAVLLVVEAAVFLVLLFLEGSSGKLVASLIDQLALQPHLALGRRPWQLLTSGLVHTPDARGLVALVGDGFGLWIFATLVEQMAGRGRMLLVLAVAQLAGNLAFAALGRWLGLPLLGMGCSAGVMGLIAAFGMVAGPLPLQLFGVAELRGRTLALLIVGLSLVVTAINRNWTGLAADAAGVAAGALLLGGLGNRLLLAWDRLRLRRLRKKFGVIDGGKGKWVN